MTETTTAPVQDVENPQVEQEVLSSFEAIVRKLEKEHGRRKKCIVKNVNYELKDTYTRVSFTLRNEVPGSRFNSETGEWVKGMTNVIYGTTYSVGAVLKENDELAWLGNIVVTRPETMNLLFSAAEIEIIQQEIAANEIYKNPFSRDGEPVSHDYDWTVNHIVSIKLSPVGRKVYDKLMDKILDF